MTKLTSRQIAAFLTNPDPGYPVVLLYGPDQGLVRERGLRLVKTIVKDLSDPFRISKIRGAELQSDPGRLADEAAAISMTGGRRVVWISDAVEDNAKTLAAHVETAIGDALIVVEAGNLSPRSKLRQMAEKSKAVMALPCYADDSRTLEALIQDTLKAHNLTLSPAALGHLGNNLGQDRQITLQELEKLALYCHGKNQISLTDVMAITGDVSALALNDIADYCAQGDIEALDKALARTLETGTATTSLLRSSSNHFQRLLLVIDQAARNTTIDSAVKALKPAVHFSRNAAFKQQCRLWDRPRLEAALEAFQNAETQCRKQSALEKTICTRVHLNLAQSVHNQKNQTRKRA